MPRLLIVSKQADEYRNLIESANLPGLELVSSSSVSSAISFGADCEVAFGEPILLREVIPALTNLRWVQSTWAGVEPLLDPSLRRNYTLTNARGVFGRLVSEYVFGYLLMFERKIFERRHAQLDRRWDATVTGTLREKVIGLLGVGSIGSYLAGTAKHFDMSVCGYTRANESCLEVDTYFHGNTRLEFARGLDYMVNVLPNTAETHHLVDATLLNALPAHAFFINVGRGSAVDDSALIAALERKKIAGAVLDVFEQEPLPKEHPFWTTPNLWMTFHTAAPSFPVDISKVFIENYHYFINGQELKYQVDFERGY
jgi:phosphoglycerate dehydrogenase-like enzyme